MLILTITWTVLKDFRKKNCLIKNVFVTRTSGDNGKKLDGHRSDEDYLTCKKIWNEFNMKNVADYHEHYLKNDVLLLADVFKNFFDMCLKFYRVDPCHYFSSPGLSQNVVLKMASMWLGKLVDIDMSALTLTYSLKKD